MVSPVCFGGVLVEGLMGVCGWQMSTKPHSNVRWQNPAFSLISIDADQKVASYLSAVSQSSEFRGQTLSTEVTYAKPPTSQRNTNITASCAGGN